MATFTYRLDDKHSLRARLGLIVLQSDETIEGEFRRMLPSEGVALYITRVESDPEVRADTLARMTDRIEGAARLLPRPLTYDAVGYACTSGTSVIGARKVSAQINAGCATRADSQPIAALLAAARALGLDRIAFLSPYLEDVSGRIRQILGEGGLASPVFGTFNERREENVAWISPSSIRDAAVELADRSGVDGIFLSCTNLRTLDVIAPIEAETGLPVLSSNQVLFWHMMRLAGLEDRMAGFGRLLEEA
ncbi:maleate cis-trans isomerase family protein [Martelella radicis]|uniref:Maleate isomerase n=1 Tax=Martelella radicis TaxID=1397476 RepID=A0A7W6KFQ2_9HYPH|nr:Asp/Glu racemase [Martelella radicis]MBB4120411.1 maleate isomerase [Martelella radicis]